MNATSKAASRLGKLAAGKPKVYGPDELARRTERLIQARQAKADKAKTKAAEAIPA